MHPAVLQIDEFQETLRRWGSSQHSNGVSMGGFCEVLQGSNSLARGFIVLSGTQHLARAIADPAFATVFRRIVVTTMLDTLSVEDVRTFFQRFIVDFVPGCPPEEVRRWAQDFTAAGLPWGVERRVSIDMVKQFLMQRISMFRAQVLPDLILGPQIPCRVPAEHWRALRRHLCEHGAARAFLSAYPPVNAEEDLA